MTEYLYSDRTKIRAYFRGGYNDVALYAFGPQLRPGDEAPVIARLSMEEAQVLIEDLWRDGLRPRDVGTAGHLAAAQEHLAHVTRLLDKVLPLALRKPTA